MSDHWEIPRSSAVEFDEKKVRQNALKDWKRDTRGAKSMFVTSLGSPFVFLLCQSHSASIYQKSFCFSIP